MQASSRLPLRVQSDCTRQQHPLSLQSNSETPSSRPAPEQGRRAPEQCRGATGDQALTRRSESVGVTTPTALPSSSTTYTLGGSE